MRNHLALVVCLALTGSIAHAAPGRNAGRHSKVFRKAKHKPKVAAPVDERIEKDERDRDSDRVAFRRDTIDDNDVIDNPDEDDLDDDLDEDDASDAPVRVRKTAKQPRTKNWHVAIGPYLWASSVDADVSLGPSSVSSGVDFFEITRHARYGAELLAEARYGRFSIYGDLLYGVVALDAAKEVGPVMVTLQGEASSLLVDGTAGYLITGGEQSLLSLEARAGVRYQRTAIVGMVNVAGADVSQPTYVDAAADALAGAHVVVRPFTRFALSGTFDHGVVGASTSTWSAATDARVRITKHVLLSLGWRTFTTQRTNVSITMHGPRAAVQLTF